MARTWDGGLDGAGLRVGIVAGRFNEFVTRPLVEGALRRLASLGVRDEDLHLAWVPGAFEIPGAGRTMISALRLDCAIGIGAVIRGDTAHFDYVCRAVTDGILRVGLDLDRPFVFGVLTVDDEAQALARAGDGPDNKGSEAALTAVETARLREAILREGERP